MLLLFEKVKELLADFSGRNWQFRKFGGTLINRDLIEIFSELAREKKEKSKDKDEKNLVENLLYSNGFASQHDQEKMEAFHETDDWGKRNQIVNELDDFRFRYLGKRLIYQNQSDALSKKEYNEIHTDIARKILNVEEDRFTTIPMSEKLCDDMRNEKGISKEKLDYINEIDEWLHQQRRIYEKAS